MDGKKKLKKRDKWFLGVGFLLLCVVVIFAFVVSSYLKKFDRTLLEENRSHLAEVADHIAAHTQSIIKDTQISLEMIADAAFQIPEPGQRVDYLKRTAKERGFAYLGYAKEDGILAATEESVARDISGEEYFRKTMLGEKQITGLVRKIFWDKAVSGILLTVPVMKQETDEKAEGILVAMMDIANLQEVLSVSSFGGEGYSYIIDASGELVLRTKSMDYNNLFLVLQNVEFLEDGNFASMKSDIVSGKPGMAVYSNLGTPQYAYYCPLGFNSWTVVNIVAEDVITGKTAVLTKELATLSIISVIVFLGLLVAAGAAFGISESSRRATEAKSAFLANMSHEIRTPMNAIVGISEMLLRGGLSAQQQDYVLNIINSGKSLLTIVNDILDISKIEAGKFTISEEEYEIESLLYDVTSIIAVRIGNKPVDFLVDLDETLPRFLIGDITRVKQILINILGNAVKFTERGFIRLTIRCSHEEALVNLKLTVEDTGIGIRKQDMDSLFTSFNQVNTHHSHSAEGTGLGLAISKKLSEMMGGGITVESEYGKGSEFTIMIKQRVESNVPIVDIAWPDSCKILLLEESEVLRDFYSGCMEKMQVPYELCSKEEQFEQRLKEDSFDYIIAGRLAIRRVQKGNISERMHLVTLLKLEEHPLMSMNSTDHTIYAPLFMLQLAAVLQHEVNGYGHAIKHTGMDLMTIKPLPWVHILVVDDNEVNLQVAVGLMQPYEMKIDCVLSGQEAINAVCEKEYDLVLMDHMMPGMDGVEALKKIRGLPGEKYQKLPVVALTANATKDARDMFMAEGFNGFLAKPIETLKLNDMLKKWLTDINEKRSREHPKEEQILVKSLSPFRKQEEQFLQSFQNSKEVRFKEGAMGLPDFEAYIKLLKTYRKSTGEKLLKLPGLLEDDFDRLIIEVHGIKGASAAIGASGIAGLAAEIETKGQEKRRSAVEAELPVFLERAKKAVDEADEFIQLYEKENPEPEKNEKISDGQAGVSKKDLQELEKAFLDYDTEQIRILLDQLAERNLEKKEEKLLLSLRGFYEEYEFEQPVSLIGDYQKTNKGEQLEDGK